MTLGIITLNIISLIVTFSMNETCINYIKQCDNQHRVSSHLYCDAECCFAEWCYSEFSSCWMTLWVFVAPAVEPTCFERSSLLQFLLSVMIREVEPTYEEHSSLLQFLFLESWHEPYNQLVTNTPAYYNFYYYCYSKCHDTRSRTYLWQML